MPLGEQAGREQLERLVGQVEQAQRFDTATRERPTRRPMSSRESPSSSTSIAHARASSTGLRSSRAMFSISASSSDSASPCGRTTRGHGLEARELRGAPPALARDQLVGPAGRPAGRAPAAARRARAASRPAPRAPPRRTGGAAGSGWARSGPPAPAGGRRPAPSPAVAAGAVRVRIAASPRPMPRGRVSATSGHLLRQLEVRLRARAVRVVMDHGPPNDGASPRRTLRGITVSKTSDGKCRRTSASTSCASLVRASCIVISIPATVSLGLSSR